MEELKNNESSSLSESDVEQSETGETGKKIAENSEKTFTQAELDRILKDRINRERERIKGIVNDDEKTKQELLEHKMKLEATKTLSSKGYPLEFVDLLDCSSEDALKKTMNLICKVYDMGVKREVHHEIEKRFKEAGRDPRRGSSGAGDGKSLDLKLKDIFTGMKR